AADGGARAVEDEAHAGARTAQLDLPGGLAGRVDRVRARQRREGGPRRDGRHRATGDGEGDLLAAVGRAGLLEGGPERALGHVLAVDAHRGAGVTGAVAGIVVAVVAGAVDHQ